MFAARSPKRKRTAYLFELPPSVEKNKGNTAQKGVIAFLLCSFLKTEFLVSKGVIVYLFKLIVNVFKLCFI